MRSSLHPYCNCQQKEHPTSKKYLVIVTLQSLKKLESHSAITSCDSSASLMLSNLPRVSMTRQNHANMNQLLNTIVIFMVNLTAVCTMAGLWSLMACTVWKTSTTPSDFRRSIIILIPQNTPVRPTPPLRTEKVNNGRCAQSKMESFPIGIELLFDTPLSNYERTKEQSRGWEAKFAFLFVCREEIANWSSQPDLCSFVLVIFESALLYSFWGSKRHLRKLIGKWRRRANARNVISVI